MNWIVKIENEQNLRINVIFDPQKENLCFRGEYKPHNQEWETLCEIFNPMDINLETIQLKLYETYEILSNRFKIYKNLSDTFKLIKEIQIIKD